MTKVNVEGKLKGNMAFEMLLDGHKLITDASVENGGNDFGPRPKVLLLAGLIGCTGIDVMSILTKMHVEIEDLKIEIDCENTEENPKVYQDIHLKYKFKGKNLPTEKLETAVTLSKEKYCGVSAMLSKSTPITHEIIIEE